MYDVAIIGAGVVGALIGRQLSRYNLSVVCLDRGDDVATGATKANSAIVHAGYDAHPGTLKAKLNVEGSRLMPQLVRELGVKYKNNGSLVVAYTDDELKELDRLYEQGVANGVPGVEVVGPARLFELEPNISREALGALYAPSGAIVCPYDLAIAAVGNAMDNGMELKLNYEVTAIEKTKGGFALRSGDRITEAAYVINAAGMYSDKIAEMAGAGGFTITPRRGEYLLLDRDCGGLVSHTIFRAPTKMGKGVLMSPTVDGNIILGPTAVNIEDREDTSTTAGGLDFVKAESRHTVPSAPLNKVITSFCGLRAVGSTGDFIINSPVAHFINVAGIESPGLSASPAIALYVEGMLRDMGCRLENKDGFRPVRPPAHRFKTLSAAEKNEVIARDGRFGRIICRCETVSEGEIVTAIHANPVARDLDALKRRLRSGMGRCQGGFCTPFIAEILARELGVGIEDITKCGGASALTTGRTK